MQHVNNGNNVSCSRSFLLNMNEIDTVYLYLAVCSLLIVWMKVMSLLVLSCLIFPGLFARTGKDSAYVCLCCCFVKTTENSIRQDTTEKEKRKKHNPYCSSTLFTKLWTDKATIEVLTKHRTGGVSERYYKTLYYF